MAKEHRETLKICEGKVFIDTFWQNICTAQKIVSAPRNRPKQIRVDTLLMTEQIVFDYRILLLVKL